MLYLTAAPAETPPVLTPNAAPMRKTNTTLTRMVRMVHASAMLVMIFSRRAVRSALSALGARSLRAAWPPAMGSAAPSYAILRLKPQWMQKSPSCGVVLPQ